VKVRDALAHGRVMAATEGGILRLIKFDKPKDGKVRVSVNEHLTSAWFTEQKTLVRKALLYVCENNALLPK
jgi:hypothetical protein